VRRREFIALAGAAVAWPLAARAQSSARPPLIGYLETADRPAYLAAFVHGLSELGYVEDRTIIIDRRSAAGAVERLPGLAGQLVRREPRVIVATSAPAALAAKAATTTIPIVVTNVNDPVGLGLVASLSHPEGNVTGLSSISAGLWGKRLELLAAVVPKLSRVGVIWQPTSGGNQTSYREVQAGAAALGLGIESLPIREPADLDAAFEAARGRVGAVAVVYNPIVVQNPQRVVAAAARTRIPAMYLDNQLTEAGGLFSYGPNVADMFRRTAGYVDKILKGAKPAELPVEEPTKFDLVINLKTAKAIDFAIPQSFLLRADEVIE